MIGHSNEAAMEARQKLFSLWHLFGCPAIFFTITPCDECSFRVRLYATCSKQRIPTVEDCLDEENCLMDLAVRRKVRLNNPGACALEYESIMQVVIAALIGWDSKTGASTNGIFGKAQAWSNACEEQSRFTLHGHMCVWIENFNKLRELLFHEKEEIREKARRELTDYFKLVAQATFGELQFSQTSSVTKDTFVNTPNDVLNPVSKQKIRDMCHHIHSQKFGGVIATHKAKALVDTFTC